MIVAREDESRAHAATGAWGRVTLDQIVARNAETRPDALAVADFADRPEWTGGGAENLTWKMLDTRVEALAAFFTAVGLQTDSVMVHQMPPTVDAVVCFLACSRAGLIVAPIPLGAREADVIALCRATGAKAIVGVAHTDAEIHGIRLRDVAAELFQIRFVFGAGGDLPDGLVDLGMVFAEAASLGRAQPLTRKGNPADHTLTVELVGQPADEEAGGARPVPLPRSHNHWIATGLMTLLEAGIGATDVILSPYALSGAVGIGAALVPWLVGGGTLVVGLPHSTEGMAEEAARRGATRVLMPARFAGRLADRLSAHRVEPMVICIGDDDVADRPMPRGTAVVDVTPLGALGLVARRRGDEAQMRALPIGPIGAPDGAPQAPVLVETRIKAIAQRAAQMAGGRPLGGEVQVRGAMVPHFNWPSSGQDRKHRNRDPEGWMPTGLGARIVTAQPPTFEVAGRLDATVRIGQTLYDLDDLDGVYRSIEGVADAAALVIEDAAEGPTIAAAIVPRPGTRFDEAAFRRAVEEARWGLAKIPTRVFTVPAIARGPSGRVLRAGMAQHLLARV